MPLGYERKDGQGVSFVMRLLKSLHSLRQSQKNWYRIINAFLTELGFKATKSGPCLHVFTSKTTLTKPDTATFLMLYVNDLILLGSDKELFEQLKVQLMRSFQMSDMGNVSLVVDMEVSRNRETRTVVAISQENYAKAMIAKHGMEGCKPLSTPGI